MAKWEILSDAFHPEEDLQLNNEFIDGVSLIHNDRNKYNIAYSFIQKTLKIKKHIALNLKHFNY